MIEPANVAKTKYFSIVCFPLSPPWRGTFSFFVPRHIIIKTHFFRQVFKLFFNIQNFLYDFIVILHKNIFSFNNFKNLVTLLFFAISH